MKTKIQNITRGKERYLKIKLFLLKSDEITIIIQNIILSNFRDLYYFLQGSDRFYSRSCHTTTN